MPAIRMQVRLTEEEWNRIDRVAEAEGVTMAEVIRRALDEYLVDEADPTTALASTFGADPAAEVPTRDGWGRG